MWFDDLWQLIECEVFSLPSYQDDLGGLANIYSVSDPVLDQPEAAHRRRANLLNYLSSLPEPPEFFLVGEAPGWRGCRVTGVPFTSEALLVEGKLPFSGQRTSQNLTPLNEISATIFWKTLLPHHPRFLTWNSLPLHPFISGKSNSNRPPKRHEMLKYLHILRSIYGLLAPVRVIGIGRRASWALEYARITAIHVRHPAHGGASGFQRDVESTIGNLAH